MVNLKLLTVAARTADLKRGWGKAALKPVPLLGASVASNI